MTRLTVVLSPTKSVLVAVLLFGACTELAPDIGPPSSPLCINEDSDPSVDVSYQEDLLNGPIGDATVGCLSCHSPMGETPIGIQIGGLDLTDYDNIIAGGAQGQADTAVAGRPCESVLYQKVTQAPPFGGRMPLNGPPFLTEPEQQLVADWIAEGARDN